MLPIDPVITARDHHHNHPHHHIVSLRFPVLRSWYGSYRINTINISIARRGSSRASVANEYSMVLTWRVELLVYQEMFELTDQ